jgi:hypothetical protein
MSLAQLQMPVIVDVTESGSHGRNTHTDQGKLAKDELDLPLLSFISLFENVRCQIGNISNHDN